ncbi:hypothetical protein CVT24_006383 [Panaeolus cyanescens]|uniref:Uncharacterized protein n=1 Tax=Panaeolus cyanescens TaxID=181874 RepID=A0A409WVH2_9AGAR|nr:hypothetical protein CVT24_006383 [Panaeolus cyanescens]
MNTYSPMIIFNADMFSVYPINIDRRASQPVDQRDIEYLVINKPPAIIAIQTELFFELSFPGSFDCLDVSPDTRNVAPWPLAQGTYICTPEANVNTILRLAKHCAPEVDPDRVKSLLILEGDNVKIEIDSGSTKTLTVTVNYMGSLIAVDSESVGAVTSHSGRYTALRLSPQTELTIVNPKYQSGCVTLYACDPDLGSHLSNI